MAIPVGVVVVALRLEDAKAHADYARADDVRSETRVGKPQQLLPVASVLQARARQASFPRTPQFLFIFRCPLLLLSPWARCAVVTWELCPQFHRGFWEPLLNNNRQLIVQYLNFHGNTKVGTLQNRLFVFKVFCNVGTFAFP